jgi:hypothetical protein
MSDLDHESIARRAYRLWEEQGRPDGSDLQFWFEAENELKAQSQAARTAEKSPPSNIDRALPPAERQRARGARRDQGAAPAEAHITPPEHFVAVLDRAHLNIYRVGSGTDRARFEPVEAFHLPAGLQHYTDRDTDQAGRFGARVGPAGGSIDERLPMQNEHERRIAAELAARLGAFLQEHDHATWDYAAGPALHHAVLDRLPASTRERLDRALSRELVHQTPAELEAYFTP